MAARPRGGGDVSGETLGVQRPFRGPPAREPGCSPARAPRVPCEARGPGACGRGAVLQTRCLTAPTFAVRTRPAPAPPPPAPPARARCAPPPVWPTFRVVGVRVGPRDGWPGRGRWERCLTVSPTGEEDAPPPLPHPHPPTTPKGRTVPLRSLS